MKPDADFTASVEFRARRLANEIATTLSAQSTPSCDLGKYRRPASIRLTSRIGSSLICVQLPGCWSCEEMWRNLRFGSCDTNRDIGSRQWVAMTRRDGRREVGQGYGRVAAGASQSTIRNDAVRLSISLLVACRQSAALTYPLYLDQSWKSVEDPNLFQLRSD